MSRYITKPVNEEIKNNEIVVRRYHKVMQVDEEGSIIYDAFLLRKEVGPSKRKRPEKDLSVVVDKIEKSKPCKKFGLCELSVGDIRKLLVGVHHSPNDRNIAHGSLTGCFTIEKALELVNISKIIS